ncbi:MAG TPA: hypothetical protein VL200_01040 [Lacunisphaera sp.]|jgi:hypothetical protein|nr:hypothetical protein [Lacunisphaera sp.]
MLGSEYNWLFTHSRSPNGLPRIRVKNESLLTLAIAFLCLLAVALHAEPAPAELPGMDGIIEGVALQPETGATFFSDVHNRCIWTRTGDGPLHRFSSDSDGLLGVFALKIDPTGRTLWASSAALPEMKGYTAADRGRALLVAYDLPTRALRRTYALPADGRAHVPGDFLLAPDGTIYATDSLAPVIWRLAPGADRLDAWLEQAQFKSLQGIALSADERSLYVADYPTGIWRIEIATRTAAPLPAPAGFNLRGVDGLYAVPGGLIGVQNGLNPPRIIRLDLDATGGLSGARVLPAGTELTDLSLGQVVGRHFAFLSHSGWDLFSNPAATPAPHSVLLHQVPLEK